MMEGRPGNVTGNTREISPLLARRFRQVGRASCRTPAPQSAYRTGKTDLHTTEKGRNANRKRTDAPQEEREAPIQIGATYHPGAKKTQ